MLDQVQFYACKRYMCVGMKSCNAAVLGDCGRFPLYIETVKTMFKILDKNFENATAWTRKTVLLYDEVFR